MNAWFYFVMGFSVLWAWEQAPHFLRARRWRALVKKMVYEGVEMYFHSALLVVLYLFCVVPYLPEEQKHIYPFLFFAGAYVLSLLRRKSEIFLMLVYALSSLSCAEAILGKSQEPVLSLMGLVAATVLCSLLLLGMRWRLRYSFVPPAVQGLPIFFLTAAFVALGLWGFQGILP